MNPTDPPPPGPPFGTGRTLLGLLLLGLGSICGGLWTYLIYLGETTPFLVGPSRAGRTPFGTVLTAAASIAAVAAGVLLLLDGRRKQPVAIGPPGGVSTALGLLLIAAAGYLFGFCTCLNPP